MSGVSGRVWTGLYVDLNEQTRDDATNRIPDFKRTLGFALILALDKSNREHYDKQIDAADTPNANSAASNNKPNERTANFNGTTAALQHVHDTIELQKLAQSHILRTVQWHSRAKSDSSLNPAAKRPLHGPSTRPQNRC